MTQILELAGKQFVVIERGEFERLTGKVVEAGDQLPPLPPRDANGNYPAIAYGRALLARPSHHRAGYSFAHQRPALYVAG